MDWQDLILKPSDVFNIIMICVSILVLLLLLFFLYIFIKDKKIDDPEDPTNTISSLLGKMLLKFILLMFLMMLTFIAINDFIH